MAYHKPQKIVGYMPHHHHKDDEDWIHAKLSPLNPDVRFKVCEAYTSVFDEAKDNEPLPHRKTGRARYAANTRLLKYMRKKTAVFNR